MLAEQIYSDALAYCTAAGLFRKVPRPDGTPCFYEGRMIYFYSGGECYIHVPLTKPGLRFRRAVCTRLLARLKGVIDADKAGKLQLDAALFNEVIWFGIHLNQIGLREIEEWASLKGNEEKKKLAAETECQHYAFITNLMKPHPSPANSSIMLPAAKYPAAVGKAIDYFKDSPSLIRQNTAHLNPRRRR